MLVEIVYWDPWIVSKSAMGPMNSCKNKLNSKISWKKIEFFLKKFFFYKIEFLL